MAEAVLPLVIRDLTPKDLPSCAWWVSPWYLAQLAEILERAQHGEVDYLAAFPPSGLPVAFGGVDYTPVSGAGMIWQLAVHRTLQSCGIGTLLIGAAEQRILGRGLRRAELRVEVSNPRARVLYERLGYSPYGRKHDSWDEQAEDGSIRHHQTMCTLMRKELS